MPPGALHTPCRTPVRKSLGDPSRVMSRSRAQSPGGASADSGSMDGGTTPRRDPLSASCSRNRQSMHPRNTKPGMNSRDPRPVGDKAYAAQCVRNVIDVLVTNGYGKLISPDKLLKDPSTKEFFDIFRFLMNQIDPQLEMDGKIEDEVPTIMRRLKYPVEVNRSKLQAISGPNTWPQLLAVLDWLAVVARITHELIVPLENCEMGLNASMDYMWLASLHEYYVEFIRGADDKLNKQCLKEVFDKRMQEIQDEIQSYQDQQAVVEERLFDFRSEHTRLLDLQSQPAQLDAEAERLRNTLQGQEVDCQRIETDIAQAEEAEQDKLRELESLQGDLKRIAEVVEGQPHSKKDIERRKCERSQLEKTLKDLKADLEKDEEDLWQLEMQDAKRKDTLGRNMRNVNDMAESLDAGFACTSSHELRLEVDLSLPTEDLESFDFDPLFAAAQRAKTAQMLETQKDENVKDNLLDEKRDVQQDLAERERDRDRLSARLQSLQDTLDESRAFFSKELDEAKRATEQTEDAVQKESVGSAAPTVREQAEVDRLRLEISSLKASAGQETHQLMEQIRAEEQRYEENREHVMREVEAFSKDCEKLCDDILRELEVPVSRQDLVI